MKDSYININGKNWKIKFVDHNRMSKWSMGECDYPAGRNPQIWIKDDLAPKEMLNTIIHEVLHAVRPELCEESVEETANIIERALLKVGLDPSSLKPAKKTKKDE